MPVRRAVAVALAILADERTIATYSAMTGTIDALGAERTSSGTAGCGSSLHAS